MGKKYEQILMFIMVNKHKKKWSSVLVIRERWKLLGIILPYQINEKTF